MLSVPGFENRGKYYFCLNFPPAPPSLETEQESCRPLPALSEAASSRAGPCASCRKGFPGIGRERESGGGDRGCGQARTLGASPREDKRPYPPHSLLQPGRYPRTHTEPPRGLVHPRVKPKFSLCTNWVPKSLRARALIPVSMGERRIPVVRLTVRHPHRSPPRTTHRE